jgi:hypothetical protein
VKNFDERRKQRAEADRLFQIGGETFVMRAGVRPEALTPYENLTPEAGASEALAVIDDLIVEFIEDNDDAHSRYRNLRERSDDPITMQDLQELTKWLVEQQTGRPTVPPSPSTASPATTGT